jgi:hypothetical protein
MFVEIRPVKRLRGAKAIDVATPLGDIMRALCEGTVDLSRVRIVCDWIQYRDNFRDVVDARQIGPGTSTEQLEIAIDVRRCGEGDLTAAARDVIGNYDTPDLLSRLPLEHWRPGRDSCIWDFNALYWKALGRWEEATGQQYEDALPGGESDARNKAAVRELLSDLFRIWDDLADRRALPDELFVVELGVGNGNQAKAFLDEFVVMERELGRDYYRRLHYLMCDYSQHVLDLARKTVADHTVRTSSMILDATNPTEALGFLRFKVFLVYISNVYDNLPCDDVAFIHGRPFQVETRAYLNERDSDAIAAACGTEVTALPGLIGKLLRLGPDLLVDAVPNFADVAEAVEFWRQVWKAIRLAERYVPLAGLDLYDIAANLSGEMLRPLLEARGDIRLNVNNGAVASFVNTLPLLHPFGRLVCHDLFVTDVEQNHTGFRGPGKYDGSVVNWVNGPLLAHIGSRKGFDVRFTPFAHRKGTNIVTMTAQVRD